MLNTSAVGGMGCPTAAVGQDSLPEGIRAEQDVNTRSVSLEQLPNTSLSPQPGFAGEHWLQGNSGGLTPRRSTEETSHTINCLAEHLGGYQSLWESPGSSGSAQPGRGCCRRVAQSHLQSTLRHLIVPVPGISPAWIYVLRGHLWRDSNNTTLLAFLFLL